MTKSVVMSASTLCCTVALLAFAACGGTTIPDGGSGTSGTGGSSTAGSTSGSSTGTTTGGSSTGAGTTTGGSGSTTGTSTGGGGCNPTNMLPDGGGGCCWSVVGGGPCGLPTVHGNLDCCPGFTCGSSNFCVTASTTTGGSTGGSTAGGCPVADAGQACDTSTDCDQSQNLVCSQTNAIFNPGGSGTCEVAVPDSTTCATATTHCGAATDKPCCGICVNSFCVDQGTQACSSVPGATCAIDPDCCTGMNCVANACTPTCGTGFTACDQANGSADCCTNLGLSCLATAYDDGGPAFFGASICYFANTGATQVDCSSNKCGPNGDAGECLLGTPCIPGSSANNFFDNCQAAGMICDQNLAVCRNPGIYDTCMPGGPSCNQLGGTSSDSIVCANLAPLVAGTTPGCFQSCKTNADCLVPFHSCDAFAGGNFCYLFSSPPCTTVFGTCNAAGTNDGVCIDITFTGQSTFGDCIQSAPTGGETGAACSNNSTRQNPADCDTSDLCAGNICQPICNTTGGAPTCPAGSVCTQTPTFGNLTSAGTCLVSCDFTDTTGGTCVTSDAGVATKCLPGLFTGTPQADNGTGFCVAADPTPLADGLPCIGVGPQYVDPCGIGSACIGNPISGFFCTPLCTNVGLNCPNGKACGSLNGLNSTGVCF